MVGNSSGLILLLAGFGSRQFNGCGDVNECSVAQDNCEQHADCINNDGSFSCDCQPGFVKQANKCNDIDECLSGEAKCQ